MLRQRILSALVLGPVALAAAWFGSWAFVALILLAGVLLGWEWVRMTHGRWGLGGWVLSLSAAAAAVLAQVQPAAGLALIPLAALVSPIVQRHPDRSFGWMFWGAAYILLPVISIVWLRGQGGETLFWLLLLVWATDIGAYAAGRTIGGPKLMPRVSPNKTWAGLIGGVVSATIVGVCVALWLPTGPGAVALGVFSGFLAVLAQAGDLAESAIKRHFGVKDSSNIIPGHGGVFDRVDGLLTTAPVVAAVCLAFGGGLPLWM